MRVVGLMALLGVAQAQPIAESYTTDALAFVPELGSAWTVAVGLEGRFSGLATESASPWPTRGLRLEGGWLRYFEGHGRWSAGPYALGALSLSDALHPDLAYGHLGVGGLVRLRLADLRFFTVSFAAFTEIGPLFADAALDAPADTPDGVGLRFAAGAEVLSLGLLWYLSPWLFVELAPWLGVESISVAPRPVSHALSGGLRLRFDITRRAER